MLSIHRPRRLVILMVLAGLLAVAGPAGASSANLHAGAPGIVTDNKDPDTMKPGVRRADPLVFSGDAYDNEMGVTNGGDDADAASAVLMADMGGQYAHAGPSADGIIAILIGLNQIDRGLTIAGDGRKALGFVAPQTDPRASALAGTGSGQAGPPPPGVSAAGSG